jgi:hypothetical protein
MIDYFGRTREEFIDFITDMLILKEDSIIANTILDEYFNVQHNNWESREDIWELRTDILVEHYAKSQQLKKKKSK